MIYILHLLPSPMIKIRFVVEIYTHQILSEKIQHCNECTNGDEGYTT